MCGVVCVVSQYDVVSRHFRSHNLATPQLVSSESSPGYSVHISSFILPLFISISKKFLFTFIRHLNISWILIRCTTYN